MIAPRRVVIVDDEPLARARLRQLLASRPGYSIAAECAHGFEAAEVIAAVRPDIVLLDIHMPDLNGFEVLQALDGTLPAVIFVTAHAEYALRAFEVSAHDYLLKPLDQERLDRALTRVEQRIGTAPDDALRQLIASIPGRPAYLQRILVRGVGELYFLPVDDVIWLDARGNYVRIHARGKAHMVRDTLKGFETRLDPDRFVRVHRSAIINIDRVVRFEPYARGEYIVVLSDGARLTTSRTHGERLHGLLG